MVLDFIVHQETSNSPPKFWRVFTGCYLSGTAIAI